MRGLTLDALESVDAALFSGDEFEDAAARDELQSFLDRWQRRLAELRLVDDEAASKLFGFRS